MYQFSSIQSLSHVQFFATPWTVASQAVLSSTVSQSLLKFMSIELVMLSNHLIFCCPLILLPSVFPSIRVFSIESALCIRWPKYGASTSASVFPMNIQDWFPLGWTRWISLQSKELSRVFSSTASINSSLLSLLYGTPLISIHDMTTSQSDCSLDRLGSLKA